MRSLRSYFTRSTVATATALSLLAPPLQAAEPATSSPDEAYHFENARQLYMNDQYLAAAESFEALHRDTGKPLYLYYAGLAREGAGHDAHATLHWQRALRAGLDQIFTPKARSRLEQAAGRTASFTITIEPATLAAGATLELTQRGSSDRRPLVVSLDDFPLHLEPGEWTATLTPRHASFERPAVTFTVAPGTRQLTQAFVLRPLEHPTTLDFGPAEAVRAGIVLTLRDPEGLAPERRETIRETRFSVPLRAGVWTYSLEAPGFLSQSGTLTAGSGGPALAVVLVPVAASRPDEPPALLPPPTRRRVALGLGLASIGPAVAGITLTAVAARTKVAADMDGNLDEVALKPANDRHLGGALLLGTTVGLWTGTVLTALPLRRRAWYGATAAGAALAVGGLAWNLGTFAAFRDEHFTDGTGEAPCELCGSLSPDQWSRDRAHVVASSLVLGLGAGLLVTTVTNLVTARRRSSLAFRPTANGFALRF